MLRDSNSRSIANDDQQRYMPIFVRTTASNAFPNTSSNNPVFSCHSSQYSRLAAVPLTQYDLQHQQFNRIRSADPETAFSASAKPLFTRQESTLPITHNFHNEKFATNLASNGMGSYAAIKGSCTTEIPPKIANCVPVTMVQLDKIDDLHSRQSHFLWCTLKLGSGRLKYIPALVRDRDTRYLSKVMVECAMLDDPNTPFSLLEKPIEAVRPSKCELMLLRYIVDNQLINWFTSSAHLDNDLLLLFSDFITQLELGIMRSQSSNLGSLRTGAEHKSNTNDDVLFVVKKGSSHFAPSVIEPKHPSIAEANGNFRPTDQSGLSLQHLKETSTLVRYGWMQIANVYLPYVQRLPFIDGIFSNTQCPFDIPFAPIVSGMLVSSDFLFRYNNTFNLPLLHKLRMFSRPATEEDIKMLNHLMAMAPEQKETNYSIGVDLLPVLYILALSPQLYVRIFSSTNASKMPSHLFLESAKMRGGIMKYGNYYFPFIYTGVSQIASQSNGWIKGAFLASECVWVPRAVLPSPMNESKSYRCLNSAEIEFFEILSIYFSALINPISPDDLVMVTNCLLRDNPSHPQCLLFLDTFRQRQANLINMANKKANNSQMIFKNAGCHQPGYKQNSSNHQSTDRSQANNTRVLHHPAKLITFSPGAIKQKTAMRSPSVKIHPQNSKRQGVNSFRLKQLRMIAPAPPPVRPCSSSQPIRAHSDSGNQEILIYSPSLTSTHSAIHHSNASEPLLICQGPDRLNTTTLINQPVVPNAERRDAYRGNNNRCWVHLRNPRILLNKLHHLMDLKPGCQVDKNVIKKYIIDFENPNKSILSQKLGIVNRLSASSLAYNPMTSGPRLLFSSLGHCSIEVKSIRFCGKQLLAIRCGSGMTKIPLAELRDVFFPFLENDLIVSVCSKYLSKLSATEMNVVRSFKIEPGDDYCVNVNHLSQVLAKLTQHQKSAIPSNNLSRLIPTTRDIPSLLIEGVGDAPNSAGDVSQSSIIQLVPCGRVEPNVLQDGAFNSSHDGIDQINNVLESLSKSVLTCRQQSGDPCSNTANSVKDGSGIGVGCASDSSLVTGPRVSNITTNSSNDEPVRCKRPAIKSNHVRVRPRISSSTSSE